MPSELRVGLVGAGAWATAAHVPGFRACDGVTVAAICDVLPGRAAAAALGIPQAYSSLAAMLAGERLDVLAIASPTDTHAQVAAAGFAAGLHVLCEKPLAWSVAEARGMVALADAAPVQAWTGFTMRFAPAVRRLQELVASGAIGRPRLLQMFLQNGQFLDPHKPHHWKMTRLHAGAGAIAEYGVHGLDIARWVMGEVDRVCATGRRYTDARPSAEDGAPRPVEVEDSCAWLMEFASGATGVCHAGWATVGRAPGLEFRVFGSDGAVQAMLSDDLPGSERLLVANGTEQSFRPAEIPPRLATPIPPPAHWRERFQQALIQHFVDAVRQGGPAAPGFIDGLRAQEVLAAVVRAMAEGRWVEV